jgi:hypothetical protein
MYPQAWTGECKPLPQLEFKASVHFSVIDLDFGGDAGGSPSL